MSAWQIVDEPALDRLGIINPALGFEFYIPHWSDTRVETAHSPPESGIRAESVCCRTKSTWTYSLTHIEDAGDTSMPGSLDRILPGNDVTASVRLRHQAAAKMVGEKPLRRQPNVWTAIHRWH